VRALEGPAPIAGSDPLHPPDEGAHHDLDAFQRGAVLARAVDSAPPGQLTESFEALGIKRAGVPGYDIDLPSPLGGVVNHRLPSQGAGLRAGREMVAQEQEAGDGSTRSRYRVERLGGKRRIGRQSGPFHSRRAGQSAPVAARGLLVGAVRNPLNQG
jgi:hypothetical protein